MYMFISIKSYLWGDLLQPGGNPLRGETTDIGLGQPPVYFCRLSWQRVLNIQRSGHWNLCCLRPEWSERGGNLNRWLPKIEMLIHFISYFSITKLSRNSNLITFNWMELLMKSFWKYRMSKTCCFIFLIWVIYFIVCKPNIHVKSFKKKYIRVCITCTEL